MFQYRRDNSMKNIISSPFTVLVLLVLVIAVFYGAFHLFLKRRSLALELQSINSKVDRLGKGSESYLKELDYLNSNEGIEREAKKRLNLKKSGENVVVVVSNEVINSDGGGGRSIWQKLKIFFSSLK